MNAKKKIQTGKSANESADLQLAFDVGHSSIGWSVLQRDPSAALRDQTSCVNILGCGVVTFGADDCLASERRDYRRQRRHARSTRQRIARMEKLLAHLKILTPEELAAKHKQAGGHSMPWLSAARVLAACTQKEREEAKLTWEKLWDVLRWYAHNRGYDANIRYSGEYKVEAFSEISQLTRADIESQAEDSSDNEKVFETVDEADEDSEKLRAGAELMERDFATPTYAETVAKILLGPDRKVKLGQPGKPGKLEDAGDKLSEADFRKLLFETSQEFTNHPKHLTNYFKGIRAAFPRRVNKEIEGLRTLTGGTEWEVRYILRQQRHLKFCDDQFERAICGQIPDSNKPAENWRIYERQQPKLYLQKQDIEALKKLRIPRKASKEAKERLLKERTNILEKKITLPKRYEGGLLFGQLSLRFENRVISNCRLSYARIVEAILSRDDESLKPYGVCMAQIEKSRRRQSDGLESDFVLAHRWAAKLSKVPTKKSREFLKYRWARKLADLTVKRSNPNLTATERQKIHEQMKRNGFLTKEELRKAISDVTNCEHGNFEQTFDATPEAADALVIRPDLKYFATNAIAGILLPFLDKKMQKRFSNELCKGKAIKFKEVENWLSEKCKSELLLALEKYVKQENTKSKGAQKKKAAAAPGGEAAEAQEGSLKKRRKKQPLTVDIIRQSSLQVNYPAGRAPYHRVILKTAFEEIMRGENPTKPRRDAANPDQEEKNRNGCLFQTPELNRSLSGAPATGNQQIEQFERWKSHWLSHSENQRRFDAREKRSPGSGQALLHSEFLTAQSQSWLAGQTNNHIVRHRLVILERLVRDIIAEPIFCNGQAERIGRVAIEVARDILTFSGKQRTGKSGIVSTLDSMRKHHEHVRRKLEKDLSETQWKNSINGELIRKGKIADDLGWKCPYTGQPFCACDLASGKMDVDHIIPKSKRLTDAMEALIVTYKAINNIKGDLTAREFVEKFQRQRIKGVNQPIRQLWDYERFVKNPDNESDKLRLSGETGHKDYPRWPRFLPGTKKAHPDYIRRKKRRMYLLIKHFEKDKDGFQPRDLTITSHLNRLSQQVLLRCLPSLPVHQITSIPGSVTGALRDARGWHLLGSLDGAASMDVMRMKKWKNPQTKKVEEIRVAKPKGEIRELTHLHHALDACVIGIVSNLLPKDGKLWELVAKGELNEADVKAFENLRDKYLKQWPPLDLHRLFQVVDNRDKDGKLPTHDHKWRLEPMPLKLSLPAIKNQIRSRLEERRVVQHVSSDMSGLAAQETVYRIFDPTDPHPSAKKLLGWFEEKLKAGEISHIPNPNDEKEGNVFIVCRRRRDETGGDKGETLHDTGKTWRWIYGEVAKSKLIGLHPDGKKTAKLKQAKAVKIIGDNFGVAILDHAKDGGARFVIIPWHKVWPRIFKGHGGEKSFVEQNAGKPPRILRNGMLIRIGKFRVLKPTRILENSIWMVDSIGDFDGTIKVDLKPCDVVNTRYEGIDPTDPAGKKKKRFTTAGCKLSTDLERVYEGGLEILKTPLTGIAACPVTSA